MKLAIAAVALFASMTTQAGLLSAAMTADWASKPTTKYKLDMYGFDARAYGFDARAYEFATDNGMKCVAVFPGGSATGWQMQCK